MLSFGTASNPKKPYIFGYFVSFQLLFHNPACKCALKKKQFCDVCDLKWINFIFSQSAASWFNMSVMCFCCDCSIIWLYYYMILRYPVCVCAICDVVCNYMFFCPKSKVNSWPSTLVEPTSECSWSTLWLMASKKWRWKIRFMTSLNTSWEAADLR